MYSYDRSKTAYSTQDIREVQSEIRQTANKIREMGNDIYAGMSSIEVRKALESLAASEKLLAGVRARMERLAGMR